MASGKGDGLLPPLPFTPEPKRRKSVADAVTSAFEHILCPITLAPPVDPVTAADGRIYEKDAIRRHIRAASGKKLKSPTTNEPMDFFLFDAPHVKQMINAMIESGALPEEMCLAYRAAEAELAENKRTELAQQANAGDANACLSLGEHYSRGTDGYARDMQMAARYFCRGSQSLPISASWPEAVTCKVMLAVLYLPPDESGAADVNTLAVDVEYSMKLLQEAAICGSTRAMGLLATLMLHKSSLATWFDPEQGLIWAFVALGHVPPGAGQLGRSHIGLYRRNIDDIGPAERALCQRYVDQCTDIRKLAAEIIQEVAANYIKNQLRQEVHMLYALRGCVAAWNRETLPPQQDAEYIHSELVREAAAAYDSMLQNPGKVIGRIKYFAWYRWALIIARRFKIDPMTVLPRWPSTHGNPFEMSHTALKQLAERDPERLKTMTTCVLYPSLVTRNLSASALAKIVIKFRESAEPLD